MKASRITVSRSKRGTTIKASGSAAQALFDALTKRVEPPAASATEAAASVARAVAGTGVQTQQAPKESP